MNFTSGGWKNIKKCSEFVVKVKDNREAYFLSFN